MMAQRLLLVGAGEMGGALLRGWLQQSLDMEITVVDPHATPLSSVRWLTEAPSEAFDIVVLALRPGIVGKALPAYRETVQPKTTVVSIAAGLPVSFYRPFFPPHTCIVRAMPNLGAALGKSATFLYGSPLSYPIVTPLFEAVGEVFWTLSQEEMDLGTALAGSGPGFLFQIAESLSKAAMQQGMDKDRAVQVTRTLFEAVGAYFQFHPAPFETLVRQVAVPGGTTEAGLHVLTQKDVLDRLLKAMLEAAQKRAHNIAQSQEKP